MWHVTRDMWHVTRDMWHMSHRGWWTLCQNFRFLAQTVWELWCSEDNSTKDQWLNYGGVCRTAPATPGLLIILPISPQGTGSCIRDKMRNCCYVSCFIFGQSCVWGSKHLESSLNQEQFQLWWFEDGIGHSLKWLSHELATQKYGWVQKRLQ